LAQKLEILKLKSINIKTRLTWSADFHFNLKVSHFELAVDVKLENNV